MRIEGRDYFKIDELRTWGSEFVEPLRTSFLDKVARIPSFELGGAKVCTDKHLEVAFRGSAFHSLIIGVLNDGNIPLRGFDEEDEDATFVLESEYGDTTD